MIVFFLLCFHSLLLGNEEVKVGMELSYPPFEMVCSDGNPCGISVDMARALGEYLHKNIKIENIAFVGLIPSLNSRKIDLILSSLTVTAKRGLAVDFSIPYAHTGLCLLASSGSAVQSIHDVNKKGVEVVVKLGTSGEAYAAKYLNEASVRVFEKEGMCVLEVVQGKADVFLYDQLSVYRNWQKNLSTTRALLKPFQKGDMAIAVRKGNSALLAQVNAFISSFNAEEGYQRLSLKYLQKEKEAFDKLGIPLVL